eukprot:6466632-Prorocentrum_lima.AAC.1
MKDFEYTAVQVSVSEGMTAHRDGNNMGSSWTISMGTFTGVCCGQNMKRVPLHLPLKQRGWVHV